MDDKILFSSLTPAGAFWEALVLGFFPNDPKASTDATKAKNGRDMTDICMLLLLLLY